jgi:hypothetical protein
VGHDIVHGRSSWSWIDSGIRTAAREPSADPDPADADDRFLTRGLDVDHTQHQ